VLSGIPEGRFEPCEKKPAKVSSTGLVRYRMNDYSVPTRFAFQNVLVGNRGKKEFIQILRLMEVFEEAIVAAAVVQAMQLGAIGFDAVKQLALARIERRPAPLDLTRYPYLPAAQVQTTAATDYAALLSRSAT
jgi:hypothetical protein